MEGDLGTRSPFDFSEGFNMHKQFQALRAALVAQFPKRATVIDGSLAAVLAGEHVLLIGPPGTAKSALVRAIAQAFGGSYFERLLTKFSTPEELFGPISLKALEQDRFVRVTTGKLPEAEFAFVDEIFKSNSAVLNSLLSIINERVFHNDGAAIACPLVAMFGASNELPDGRELEALFDRFLLRFDVQYLLVASNLRSVLAADDPAIAARLSMADLQAAQADVAAVKITDDTIDALLSIRDACRGEGIVASDWRWKKSLKLVKASAWLAGEKKTCPEDLAILTDSLWREPKERSKVARIVGALSDPASMQSLEILDAAREIATKVSSLKSGDRKAYIAQAAQAVEQFDAQQVKLADLAKSGGRRAKAVISDAVAEIQGLHAEVARAVSTGLGLGMRSLR
jgi:MoxR-like ATPase